MTEHKMEKQMSEEIQHSGATLDPDAEIDREFVSTKGGAFTIDEKQIGDIDMIILAAAPARSFFAGAYVPGEESFPDCFSVGRSGVPSINSPAPQSPDCVSCPLSQWDGNSPPKCKERRKLVGLRVVNGEINPKLTSINIPPTSVRGTKKNPGGWRKYLGALGISNGLKVYDVVTGISCKSNAPQNGYRLEFVNKGPAIGVKVDPAILAGFKTMAAAEAIMEPKPKNDVEADVVAEATKNTATGKTEAKKPEAKKPKF